MLKKPTNPNQCDYNLVYFMDALGPYHLNYTTEILH